MEPQKEHTVKWPKERRHKMPDRARTQQEQDQDIERKMGGTSQEQIDGPPWDPIKIYDVEGNGGDKLGKRGFLELVSSD